MPLSSIAAGFGTGLGLIVAIGAQNAYLLRLGLTTRRSITAAAVVLCVVSDALLIVAGIAGLGFLTSLAPWIISAVRFVGAAFLFVYGCTSLLRAIRGTDGLEAARHSAPSLLAALATMAAFTWLNPHVYLDTVFLLGSVGSTFGDQRWWFALGAISASTLWFSALGFGAARLRPLFAKAWTWRTLDALIAAIMWALAATLLVEAL